MFAIETYSFNTYWLKEEKIKTQFDQNENHTELKKETSYET